MWILMALLSAFFAGVTAILGKLGVKHTDSTVATAVRTTVVLAFSWLLVLLRGLQAQLGSIGAYSYLFLVLSGLCTGASWLCYFHALKIGSVNQVMPVDKSSTVLTMLLAFLILNEPLGLKKWIAMALILSGTFLMMERKPEEVKEGRRRGWLIYAVLSAVFAALTSILGKLGIQDVPSDLGTALRTAVVLVMAWTMVFISGKGNKVRAIDRGDMLYILLSGIATGLSWLCYYRALQDGQASVVVPLDKLSLVVTIVFSRIFFKERLGKRALLGFLLLLGGTALLLF